ncbi:MAG: tetratricopeptide repeat protein [Pseudomonadota bacterium]|nr:tetratricopeptide repeat protein [Pseudomonadota bacterium]
MTSPDPMPPAPDLFAEAMAALHRGEPGRAAQLVGEHLRHRPRDADALNLLGTSLLLQSHVPQAIDALQAAHRLHPAHPDVLNNLGRALRLAGRLPEASAALLQALDLQPHHPFAFTHLVDVLAAQGRHRELALTAMHPRLAHVVDAHADDIAWALLNDAVWDVDLPAVLARLRAAMLGQAERRLLTLVPLVLWDDPALHRAVARQFAAQAASAAAAPAATGPAAPADAAPWPSCPAGRLRIGYLGSGFRNHVLGYLCTELLALHDRSRYEVVGYFASAPDDIGRQLRQACDRHREVAHLADAALAAQIRRDAVDILIECDGLASNTRIAVLGARPAPLQLHFLDYPGPLSMPGVDYTVVDRHVVPPGDEAHFDEAVLALPHTYHPFDTRSYRPQPASRASLGWPEGVVVYGSLSNSYKLTPEVFDGRMRIVRAVPGSVLVQVRPSAAAEATLRARWAGAGLAPERLILVDRVAHGAHLERLAQVDLCLDTFPFTSGTGAMEALWCDVPLLTLRGRCIAARNAASILTTHGVPECVAHSSQDFEARAIELGQRPAQLQALRQRLAAARARSPLFDMRRFVATLERGLEAAWARQRAGMAPARIDVPP